MTNPVGQYTEVRVRPIQGGPGDLRNGTATLSATNILSAGTFPGGDQPNVGEYFNITGTNNGRTYEFPGRRCTHSGGTSDFAEP